MRKTMVVATGLVCVSVTAAAMLASTAGVTSQTIPPTRTPAVDVPTATDIPAATATASATPIAISTATAIPAAGRASEEENAGENDPGSGTCEKHRTPSHGETGGNHCGRQKHRDGVAASVSDSVDVDEEPNSD